MTAPKRPDRWDGWDDPDYEPTEEELNERGLYRMVPKRCG